MEFPFHINDLIKKKITKIGSNLLPEEFTGDRRNAWNCASRISDILDEMGRASAKAQGLQKAITSGDRMRNFEHVVYLLIDPDGNSGKGTVVGLLKVGHKKLFVFDATGAHHEMEPLCVLDFYVHESKQRMGCGKFLYEYMLKEEDVTPQHLAIDRPSEKFLGFLYKHYGLSRILPQSNNYVVFDGFFINRPGLNTPIPELHGNNKSSISQASPQPSLTTNFNNNNVEGYNGQASTFGRHAAHKPPATIGKILQSSAVLSQQNGGSTNPSVPLSDHGSVCDYTHSSPVDGRPQDIYYPVEALIEELRVNVSPVLSPTSCRQHHDDSLPIKRDLKFYHSPLW